MSASLSSSRSSGLWIFLLVALALFSALAMRRSVIRAMGMKVETTTASPLSQLKPGEEAKFVLEISHVDPSTAIEGIVLEKQTEIVYRRTAEKIKILFDAKTPVVMGKSSGLHEKAVVHVTAKMADDRLLHASQIVVLTGYVKVE